MKQRGRKARILLSVMLVAVILIMQLPFCRMNQIGTTCHDSTFYESIIRFEYRVPLYVNTLFLTKGKTYHDVLFSNGKTYDIKFGWDNCIAVLSGDEHLEFEVDSIDVTLCVPPSRTLDESFSRLEADSAYTGIEFYDNDNYLRVFRQLKSRKFKGRMVGFEMRYNGKMYHTGKESFFDY